MMYPKSYNFKHFAKKKILLGIDYTILPIKYLVIPFIMIIVVFEISKSPLIVVMLFIIIYLFGLLKFKKDIFYLERRNANVYIKKILSNKLLVDKQTFTIKLLAK